VTKLLTLYYIPCNIRIRLSIHPLVSALSITQSALELAEICMITCVDKASSQPFFMRKQLALQLVLDHVQSGPLHSSSYVNIHAIKTRIRHLIPALATDTMMCISTMYPIPKIHKPDIAYRFITAYSHTLMTSTSQLIHIMLDPVQTRLTSLARRISTHINYEHNLNIHLDCIVHDAAQTCINLPTHVCQPSLVCAYISKCFDAMPLDLNNRDSIYNTLASGFSLLSHNLLNYQFHIQHSRDNWKATFQAECKPFFSRVPVVTFLELV
jgi:hypothetical protein